MGVQERTYMGRDGEQSLFPESPVELVAPPIVAECSTQTTKALRAATSAVEKELTQLKSSLKARDEQIAALKATVSSVTAAGLERPDIAPIIEGICTMLCGLVYCRPIDEADRLRIVAAADKGHALLDQIAGCHVDFPAARLLYEEASRQYFDFVNQHKNGR